MGNAVLIQIYKIMEAFMKQIKSIYIAGFIAILGVFVGTFILISEQHVHPLTSGINADYYYYTDLNAVINDSDAIIEGIVVNTEENVPLDIAIDSSPLVLNYAVSTISVTNVLYGDLEVGDTIQVKQLMNDTGEENYLSTSCSYFLFLKDYRSVSDDMPFSVINENQGNLEIVDETVVLTPDTANLFTGRNSVAYLPDDYGDNISLHEIEEYIISKIEELR